MNYPDNRPRWQFTLAAALLGVSLLCATISTWRLTALFLGATGSYPGAAWYAARTFAASMIFLGGMIGAITAGQRRTAVQGATIGAAFSTVILMGLLVSCWILAWSISRSF